MALVVIAALSTGCDRTVTKDDCDRVGTHMRKVWDAEARTTAPKGEPANENDGLYKSIRDPKARAAVTADFSPLKGAKAGELEAKFDIVLGLTAEA